MGDFLHGYVVPTAIIVAEVLAIVVPLLIAIAYLTYAERKVLAAMQLRRGPNVVGPFGLLQPFADGLKLLYKETVIPSGANRVVFIAAPMITFVLAMVAWAVIPFGPGIVLANINVASWIYTVDETWWVAGLAGALLSVVWNYAVSTNLIWRPRFRR